MKAKTETLVITFHTTAAALKMEREAKEAALPGRLIPVPREISAGCGLAWATEPENEADFKALVERAGIACGESRVLMI